MTRILITTGIYPPQIGGPAQYAKNLKEELAKMGHKVRVISYGKIERLLPSGLRHNYFASRIFFSLFNSDFCITLDTLSVGWPSVFVSKLLGKKVIIRTGGDFLWESYVERTGDLVLLKDFYNKKKSSLSLKEKVVFFLTKWTLENASAVVYSTKWQKDIFESAYDLMQKNIFIIENYYGEKISNENFETKNFLAFTRPLKWKNVEKLKSAFEKAKATAPEISLDVEMVLYEESIRKMKNAYAVILVSLGDISPNMIMDAIRYNRPFILTRETGIFDRIGEIGIFVDPQSEDDIKNKILFLADKGNYMSQKKKLDNFSFTHSWTQIAGEFLSIYGKIKE